MRHLGTEGRSSSCTRDPGEQGEHGGPFLSPAVSPRLPIWGFRFGNLPSSCPRLVEVWGGCRGQIKMRCRMSDSDNR